MPRLWILLAGALALVIWRVLTWRPPAPVPVRVPSGRSYDVLTVEPPGVLADRERLAITYDARGLSAEARRTAAAELALWAAPQAAAAGVERISVGAVSELRTGSLLPYQLTRIRPGDFAYFRRNASGEWERTN